MTDSITNEEKKYGAFEVYKYYIALVLKYSKLYFAVVFLEIVILSAYPFINIIFPRFLISELFGNQELSMIVFYVGCIISGNIIYRFLKSVINTVKRRKGNKLSRILDLKIGEKCMEMDYEYVENPKILTQSEKAKTGMLYSGGIESVFNNITMIISNTIALLGIGLLLSFFGPVIILVIAATILMNMFLNSKISEINVKFHKDQVDDNRKFNYYFGLNLDFKYGKDIRLYDAANLIMKRTQEYKTQAFLKESKMHILLRRLNILSDLVSCAQIIVLNIYVASKVIAGDIDFASYVMLIAAAVTFASCITGIIKQITQMKHTAEFMGEYVKFMDYQSVKFRNNNKLTNFDAHSHTIEFKDVSFRYPGHDNFILDELNIKIESGKKLSIVGLNGAGKTTFIKLLCRLYDPTEGVILIDGVDVREYDYQEYLNLFSVVFQDFGLLAFSINENISCTENAEDALKVKDALKRSGIFDKVNSLKQGAETLLYKNLDNEGVELSGGEMQKLAIARAIYKDSPIVILDEPTAALDPIAEYEIYNHFNELIGSKTTIYISHRMSSCRFCDNIAVFDSGNLKEYGTHKELLSNNGIYAEMWNAQAQYYKN